MKRPRWKRHWKKRRSRYLTGGMEVSAALSIATQMALLCPPGFEEWVCHELVGDADPPRHWMGPATSEVAGALRSDRDVDRALTRYRRKHRRALAAHHWLISDYSTGRPLNPIERMLFTAAARDQHVAYAIGTLNLPSLDLGRPDGGFEYKVKHADEHGRR